MQVALFITCLSDSMFPEAGRATMQHSNGSATKSLDSGPRRGRSISRRELRLLRLDARVCFAGVEGVCDDALLAEFLDHPVGR
jgi:hypothetical protein